MRRAEGPPGETGAMAGGSQACKEKQPLETEQEVGE